MPLFVAPDQPDCRGMFRIDGSAALRHGLGRRPLRETVAGLLEWTRQPAAASAAQPGLSPAREAELLAEWRAARGLSSASA